MDEVQAKQIQELVQTIADDDSISFDAAFKVAMGILRLHAIDNVPKGEGRACGGTGQAGVSQADQP